MNSEIQKTGQSLVNKTYFRVQGCLANSDGANSDDRANSDDFLGKSLNFFPSYFLLFFGYFDHIN